jgi:hypothetical protein
MNKFLCRLLLLCSLLPAGRAFGQRKLSLSATIAPVSSHTNYDYMVLYPNSDGQVVEPILLNGKISVYGYLAGPTLDYTYASGWSVSTGVWYQQLTRRQARSVLAGPGTTTLHNRTIRIPLLLNYRVSGQRLSPYFSLGTFLDFPLAARVIVTRDGQSTQKLRLDAAGGPVFHVLAGVGGQYQFSDRCTLTVQPVAAYNLGRFGGSYSHNASYELSLLTKLAYSF